MLWILVEKKVLISFSFLFISHCILSLCRAALYALYCIILHFQPVFTNYMYFVVGRYGSAVKIQSIFLMYKCKVELARRLGHRYLRTAPPPAAIKIQKVRIMFVSLPPLLLIFCGILFFYVYCISFFFPSFASPIFIFILTDISKRLLHLYADFTPKRNWVFTSTHALHCFCVCYVMLRCFCVVLCCLQMYAWICWCWSGDARPLGQTSHPAALRCDAVAEGGHTRFDLYTGT